MLSQLNFERYSSSKKLLLPQVVLVIGLGLLSSHLFHFHPRTMTRRNTMTTSIMRMASLMTRTSTTKTMTNYIIRNHQWTTAVNTHILHPVYTITNILNFD